MDLYSHITRMPRPFDQDRAADAQALTAWAPADLSKALTAIAASSPYLFRLLELEQTWLEQACAAPEDAASAEIAALLETPTDALGSHLRRAKRRVALLTAVADLMGVWTLQQVTQTLTQLADTACEAALRASLLQQIKRRKLPQLSEDDVITNPAYVIFAMGKMGAAELNYSSDIDLICLFDETRFEPDDFHDVRAAFVRATRMMVSLLSDNTAEGYVFRTDLRLRPDPSVTPACMAMEAAERYYESLGRTWERAAWIKARPCAGDLPAGRAFQRSLSPFVWRKHLDFAAIDDAHNMRLAIRAHKGLGGPITLPDHNMKLGRGGIREIEFFTQTRQLISGGRDRDLRCRQTVEGLQALATKSWIPSDIADRLSDHYRFHRTVEHRLQMVNDAQTHSLPNSPKGFERLACLMAENVDALRADIQTRLKDVHDIAESFFAPTERVTQSSEVAEPESASRWLTYPALRSLRAREIFETIKPDILGRLNKADRPEEALAAFDQFLGGLPAGVQVFSLFEANPQLIDLLIDITSVSPVLAQYLSRNSAVFDAVIGGQFFADWPQADGLAALLSTALDVEPDYERKLDVARRWGKEWHFRIGVHLLRGLITPAEAAAQYADLAQASLFALFPHVVDQFATRHGQPPGHGAVVVGMGSLGAGRLHAQSDLDLIVIYDADGVDASDGRRPLAVTTYYARLTQALVTAMTARTAEGRLYEVDMRLRPSGNQGPVATSFASFETYQRDQAWMWEHLALTRARVIAGPAVVAQKVEDLRNEVLTRGYDQTEVLTEVATMRARILAAKGAASGLEPKLGRGRMQDIELFAQGIALLSAKPTRNTPEALSQAVACNILSPEDVASVRDTYALCSALQVGLRLIQSEGGQPSPLGQGGGSVLSRLTQSPDVAHLEQLLADKTAQAADIIDRALPSIKDAPE